jgi:uncharacterized protein
MKRRLAKVFALISILYVCLSLCAGIFLAEMAMRHTRQPLPPRYVPEVKQRVAAHRAVLGDVAIAAADGVVLKAWYIVPAKPNGSTVILFHGVTDTRVGVAGFGELFLASGYTILLPDARNHGESGGDLATYGVREAADAHAWVDWINERTPTGCVYGFGESMGASILLQSLRYENRFCAVIAESPFADFREAAYDRAGGKLHTGPWLGKTLLRPAIEIGILYARWHYGVDFNQASPRAAVANSAVPVLLIHGQGDVNIYPRNSEAIFAARNGGLELWRVPAAAHCGAWAADPKVFEQRVLGWFADHTANRSLIAAAR